MRWRRVREEGGSVDSCSEVDERESGVRARCRETSEDAVK